MMNPADADADTSDKNIFLGFKTKIMDAIKLLPNMSSDELEQVSVFWPKIRGAMESMTQSDTVPQEQQGDVECGDVESSTVEMRSEDRVKIESDAPRGEVVNVDVTPRDGRVDVEGVKLQNEMVSVQSDTPRDEMVSVESDTPRDEMVSVEPAEVIKVESEGALTELIYIDADELSGIPVDDGDGESGASHDVAETCVVLVDDDGVVSITNAVAETDSVHDGDVQDLYNDVSSRNTFIATGDDVVQMPESTIIEGFQHGDSVENIIEMVPDENGYLMRRVDASGDHSNATGDDLLKNGGVCYESEMINPALPEDGTDDGVSRYNTADIKANLRKIVKRKLKKSGAKGTLRRKKAKQMYDEEGIEIITLKKAEAEFINDILDESLDENMLSGGVPSLRNPGVGGELVGNGVRKSRRIRDNNIKPKSNDYFVNDAAFDDDDDDADDGEAIVGRRPAEVTRTQPSRDLNNALADVTCEFCGIVGNDPDAMDCHRRLHTGDRPFSCHICRKKFTTKGNLSRHIKTHSGEKPHKCEVCGKCFTEKKSLVVHMREHTGERPFKCPMCDQAFAQSGILQTHIYTHTGHKGHLCDHCGKSFRQKCHLRIHQRRVTKNARFQCSHCDRKFYTRRETKDHAARRHGQVEPATRKTPQSWNRWRFTCEVCAQTFTRQKYLDDHLNYLHPQYNCGLCNRGFYDYAEYTKHAGDAHSGELVTADTATDDDSMTFIFKNNDAGAIDDLTTLILSQIGQMPVAGHGATAQVLPAVGDEDGGVDGMQTVGELSSTLLCIEKSVDT